MDKYFDNKELIENTLLSYFCDENLLKLINKKFYVLNYEKYNTHLQPHGIEEFYYPNNKIKQQMKTYKNGKLHGLEKIWHIDGKLWVQYNYKNGKLHGLCESWDRNGVLRYKENYKNGKKDGLCEIYDEYNKLKRRETYKDGITAWFGFLTIKYYMRKIMS